MIEIEKPRIECVENPADEGYGKFVVEPLERGYGTTLGNSLRRVLLSSLPGTAVTTIKIAGVQHEFSTIPGVKEDVPEIILNLKGLIARLYCDGTKTVYIEATGEGEVTAGDITADGEVEILNPEMHIATLGPDATLSMELTIAHGRGYVPAERNKPAQVVAGVIPIDSIYTPVLKVNYAVENTRVGNQTDYDKLTIEVWTDKTISPRDAVSLGAKILCDHFTLFTDLSQTISVGSTVVEKVEAV
jgi:DNA-directed RNA polymerase subunit alpha